MTTFTHTGPWDSHSRESPALKFLEKYTTTVDSRDLLQTPSSAFYSRVAIFRDTSGSVHIGGSQIWDWLARLSSPFSQILHEVVELRVVRDTGTEGRDMMYAEFVTHFWFREELDEVQVPRFFVFVIGKAEEGAGTDGLQIEEVRVFWDTGVIGRFVSERKKALTRIAAQKEMLGGTAV